MRQPNLRHVITVLVVAIVVVMTPSPNALAQIDAGAPDATVAAGPTPGELATINAYVQSYFPDTAIKYQFTTIFNETVNCVDFYALPSVQYFQSKGISVPMSPPPFTMSPPANIPALNPAPGSMWMGEPDQDGKARRCPSGTVGKFRPTIAQIVAAGGVGAYTQSRSRKLQSCSPQGLTSFEHDCYLYGNPPTQRPLLGDLINPESFDHAVGILTNGGPFWGLLTIPSVYTPTPAVNNAYEHSVSQLWLQAGSCSNVFNTNQDSSPNECSTGTGGNAVQSLEVALVNIFNQSNPFLEVFTTADGYYTNCAADSPKAALTGMERGSRSVRSSHAHHRS
jgi:hypothetical protein